jgi:hypothetical protein
MIGIRLTVQSDLDITPEIEQRLDEIAESVPAAFRQGVDSDTPRGRLYRRGAITGRLTKKGLASGFRQTSKTRMAVGSRFHRASAPGQFPAKDTGELYNRIRVVKKGRFGREVRFEAAHAGFVEQIRPFAEKTAELVVQRFI